ncbi:MAG: hypothetical protein CVU39_15490 [Chloroflexi bacterium HGW-Chloroflexi-10]|nr:MAG: hypothetical protein CVU39_15490 [Chloroflexi bacterium HGW-Chloroflexi-10]
MHIQLTVIGLDKIGTSIGLALKPHIEHIHRVGHDRKGENHKKAIDLGAFDETPSNIKSAVENADIVILAVPIDEILETIEFITPSLKAGTVLMDTSPLKISISNFVTKHLPEERHFVTFQPTINPMYLHESGRGIENAHEDLFKNSKIIITSSPSTNGEALKLAADLAKFVGSQPFFADPFEIDGLIAATEILPQITAAAYIHAVTEQAGWVEGRKVAGSSFQSLSQNLYLINEREFFGRAATQNKENTIRVINNLIISLINIRDQIEHDEGHTIEQWFKTAKENHEKWLRERHQANWDQVEDYSQVPTSGEFLGKMFGFGKRKKEK